MQKKHFQLFQVRTRVDIRHVFNTTLRAWNTRSEDCVKKMFTYQLARSFHLATSRDFLYLLY